MTAIICDSGTDTSRSVLEQYPVQVVPLMVSLGDKEYRDGPGTVEKVLDFMKDGFPKTATPSYAAVKEGFQRLIKEGHKQIIAINISSGLSGTHGIFQLVAVDLADEDKDIEIEVIDSKTVSIGAGLLVAKAAKLLKEGLDFRTVVDTVRGHIHSKVNVFYTIPTLKYLEAGGRIGKVSATVGKLLNIKPVISVNTDGIYYTVTKARGMTRAVGDMINLAKEYIGSNGAELLIIAKTTDDNETLSFVDRIQESLGKLRIAETQVTTISASMTVHTGPGLIGLGVMLP